MPEQFPYYTYFLWEKPHVTLFYKIHATITISVFFRNPYNSKKNGLKGPLNNPFKKPVFLRHQ